MKAIVYRRYGSPDVLEYEDIEKPTPGDDEVLIEVRAASVNPLDWHFMRGSPYAMRIMTGLRKPKVTRLGVDVAGQVEAVGKSITGVQPGDEVFGTCRGAFAEYACTAESTLVRKPLRLSFEQAASAPVAGYTALQALRGKGKVHSGQKVLINGAAGGVGTFAVQIAKSFGAEVTGVCSSRNVEMVRSIGADRVIDYTREDFTRGGQRYDVILDCVGNHSLSAFRRLLTPGGRYLAIGGSSLASLVKAMLSSMVMRNVAVVMAKGNQADLAILGELMEDGTVTPVLDRRYPLSDVPEAIRYLETGHARGKVVITLE